MAAIETEYRLEESARGTIAADGSASVTNVGPKLPGERWRIRTFSASGAASAKLQIMRGNAFDASRQLDVTRTAEADSSETDVTLQAGETLSFWWTEGTTGAQMVCSISGERFVPGKRAY